MAGRVGICVLGLGEMGKIHARSLARVPGVDLYLAAARPGVSKQLGSELFAARTFESYEGAFNDPGVKAVVIASQPKDHPAHIVAAAKAGKHIFSEKPLGYSVKDISTAIQATKDNGVQLVSGFMRRFDPGYVAAKKKVESGDIGSPIVLKCTSGDADYPEKYQRDMGFNSMLLDLGVHDIDLARWLLGSEVKRVYVSCDALVYPKLKNIGDSDIALIIMEMTNGTKATIHLSRALGYGYNVTSQLVCSKGSLDIGELKQSPVIEMSSLSSKTDICPEFPQRFEIAFQEEMRAFAELVRDGTTSPGLASAEDGRRATEVAEALVASWKSGVPVDV